MNYGMGDVSDWLSAWFGIQGAVPPSVGSIIVAPPASPIIPPLQQDITVTPQGSYDTATGEPLQGGTPQAQPVGIPVWVWAIAGVFVLMGFMGGGGRR